MALFNNLSERLTNTVRNITGRGRLTEKNIKETLKEIRNALLEADVALPVVKKFIDAIRSKAIGQDISKQLNPGQALVKIVNHEMTQLMGTEQSPLNLNAKAPVVILMAGLQGAGKTTTAAKLAVWIKQRLKKSVFLTSIDIYRPAALEQLKTLAEQIEVAYYINETSKNPLDIAKTAIEQAKKQIADVIIIDTAGRLHVDDEMMRELQTVSQAINPTEILFVVDSMTGQDAAHSAKAFNGALPLTGVILTKTDGDARGGAALSVSYITEKPIKFMGVGEKVDAIEPFYPDRVASRILGMGDVLSLVEDVESKIDKKEAEKLAKKVKTGQGFDLEDFRKQLQQMKKMGGMAKLMEKMPGMTSQALPDQVLDDKSFTQMEAMISSMTPQERHFPDIIKGRRKQRITQGSGTDIQDLNRLLKQHRQMQKMMKKLKGGGMAKMMRRLGSMGQGMPGGHLPF